MTTLLHRAVAAHRERTTRLAEAYSLLDRTAATAPEPQARLLHAELWREFDAWRQQDISDSRADLVALGPNEQTEIVDVLRDMLARAQLFDQTRRDDEMPASPVLEADIDQPPSVMPRNNLRALRRSFERYQRLKDLEGPEVILCSETSLTAQALRWDWEIRPYEPYFDAEGGFLQT